VSEKITDRMEWITHKGVRIIFADDRGLEGEPLLQHIRECEKALVEIGQRQGEGSILIVTEVTDAVISGEVMNTLKQASLVLKPYIKASAGVGITGIRKYLLNVLSTFSGVDTKAFDTMEEAKDWLAEQAKTRSQLEVPVKIDV
jgi:hypothetical protein